jgi:hypothetical protein
MPADFAIRLINHRNPHRCQPIANIIYRDKVVLLLSRLALLYQVGDGQRPACGHRRIVIKMNSYSASRHPRQKTRWVLDGSIYLLMLAIAPHRDGSRLLAAL